MSTPSLPDQKTHDVASRNEHVIAASEAIHNHALTCAFCKTPGTHNRGICKENLLLQKALHDAYNAAADAFEAANPSTKS